MTEPYHQRTALRVRVDECDGTRAATPGRLFALVDEARFELYAALEQRAVVLPARHVAKAERVRIARAPRSREHVVAEAWIGRVGTTSLDIAQRITTEDGEPLVEIVSTLVALGARESDQALVPVAFHESHRAHAHAPLDLPVDAPEPPDSGVAFLRTLDATHSHENQGRHIARTRMVDWLNDMRRLGVERGAFEHTHADDGGALKSASFVFEREGFAGDGLRLAMSTSAPGVFDATLIRGRDVLTRARLRTV